MSRSGAGIDVAEEFWATSRAARKRAANCPPVPTSSRHLATLPPDLAFGSPIVRGMSSSVPPSELIDAFAQIARTLLAQDGVGSTVQKVVELATQTIDGCDDAAISMVKGRTVLTEVSTDDVGFRVDAIQYETNQGPCLDAIRDHEMVVSDDFLCEERWPDFARRSESETGVRSMLSFRLFVEKDTMGALNMYSKQPHAFSAAEASQHVGSVFAAHAAVAWSAARQQQGLEEALRSRDAIGQAKGILMVSAHLTEDQAFAALKEASNHLNMKLRAVADVVTRTGKLPEHS